MIIYQHRVNSLEDYKSLIVHPEFGYECDVRFIKGQPYLSHDLIYDTNGLIHLDSIIERFSDRNVIINVKENGIDFNYISKIKLQCKSLLLLDLSFPEIVKAASLGLGENVMWRVSEFEGPSVDVLKSLEAKWIWLDSFNSYWFTEETIYKYQSNNLQVCMVSNELQGRDIYSEIESIKLSLEKKLFNAVCTKNPSFYLQIINQR